MEPVVVLVGTEGHVAGEEYALEYGKKIVIGRSRSADWSLVSLKSWRRLKPEEQELDTAFRTISGKHFEITMFNLGSIELTNLSGNGTRLDGKKCESQTITDLAEKTHEISFGVNEALRLEVREDGVVASSGDDEEALDQPELLDEASDSKTESISPIEDDEKADEKTDEKADEKADKEADDKKDSSDESDKDDSDEKKKEK